MSFLSLFSANSSTSAVALPPSSFNHTSTNIANISAVANGVSFALRGSAPQTKSPDFLDHPSLLSAGLSWFKSQYRSWFGSTLEPQQSIDEAAFKAYEVTGGPDSYFQEARSLQAALPTQIPVDQPAIFTLSRLQADAINGNGTYAVATSTLLDGKALPNVTAIEAPALELTKRTFGSGYKILTPFNSDGFAVAGKESSSLSSYVLLDKNLTNIANGSFQQTFTGSVNPLYFVEGKTFYAFYLSGTSALSAQVQQFSVNSNDPQSLIRIGTYNTPQFAANSPILRQLGDPTLPNPKTFLLTTGFIGEWEINKTSSTFQTNAIYPISPGYVWSSTPTFYQGYSLSNSSWVFLGLMRSIGSGEIHFNSRYENGSLELRSVVPTGYAGILKSTLSFLYTNEGSSTPAICQYSYTGVKMACVSTPARLIGAIDNDIYLLNVAAGALQTLDTTSLVQTSQLTFPGVTTVDNPAFPDSGFITFSSGGSVYKATSTGSFGNVWKMTLPTYLTYALTPGTTHTITVNFTSGGNNTSTFTQSFIPMSSTPLVHPNCNFAFTNPLGASLIFNISSNCIQDSNRRTWTSTGVAAPNYGFSATPLSPKISTLAIQGLNLSDLQIYRVSRLENGLIALSTAGNKTLTFIIPNAIVPDLAKGSMLFVDSNQEKFLASVNTGPYSLAKSSSENPCFASITDYTGYQRNLTTFCIDAQSSNPLSVLSSSTIPLGNGNANNSLGPDFQQFPFGNGLIGWRSFNSSSKYWVSYNISNLENPILTPGTGLLGFPSITPQNIDSAVEAFDSSTPLWDGFFVNEKGVIGSWVDLMNFKWQARARLSAPILQPSAYLFDSLFTVIENRYVMYIPSSGKLQVWDLKNLDSPALAGEISGTVQYMTLALSSDQSRLALMSSSQKISVFFITRFSDGTFGFSLSSETQMSIASSLATLIWKDSELWICPIGQTSPTLLRLTPPNGDWHTQYTLSGVVNSLQTQDLNIGFSDGLGRQINLPVSITGTPLPVVPSSTALIPLGDKAYAYTLAFNGNTVFSPGMPTPTFTIDLNVLFTSPNQAYVPGTSLSFFFGEATVPSFVTIFDRGHGRYSLQIVGGIFPAQAVNRRPDGSQIENSQPIIVQVGDTLGSSGIDLHLVINIQGHTPRLAEAPIFSAITGQRLREDLPETVTGIDQFGFETNTDLLDTCNEGRGAPEWLSVRCRQVVGTTPQNSVGTTTFQVRPRTYIPGTGQLVGVGDWQEARVTNPGQSYTRPLGSLVQTGTSNNLRIGAPSTLTFNSLQTQIFRNADGTYSNEYALQNSGASRLNLAYINGQNTVTLTILSPTSAVTLTLSATQPNIYQNPETASVSATLPVLGSLVAELPDVGLTAGTPTDYPITISSASIAETFDISVKFSPITGSGLGTLYALPEALTPYIDTANPRAGGISLRSVPRALLTQISQDNGISTYQLLLNITLAENQNTYWNTEISVQDYAGNLPLNAESQTGLTLIVQDKPTFPQLIEGEMILTSDQLAVGARTSVSLRNFAFDASGKPMQYQVSSSNEGIIHVTQSNPQIPSAVLTAVSPGYADIMACVINFYNHTVCKNPERLRVPDPAVVGPGSSNNSQIPGISSGVSVGGPLLFLIVVLGPILLSLRKQRAQAHELICYNRNSKKTFMLSLPASHSDNVGHYQTSLEAASRELSHGRNPIQDGMSMFQFGLVSLLNTQIQDQLLITNAEKLLFAMAPIRSKNNPEPVIQGLTLLLLMTTLIAASRTADTIVDYEWRNRMLRWVDDKASLIQGKTAADYQAKALLKLIRSTLEALKTNETALHYVLAHIVGVLGTLVKYFKSRKHQGDVRQTSKVIEGVLALTHDVNKPSDVRRALNTSRLLLENPDWRVQILGLMIQASTATGPQLLRDASELHRVNSGRPKTRAQRCCGCLSSCRCKKHSRHKAEHRVSLVTIKLAEDLNTESSRTTSPTAPDLHAATVAGGSPGASRQTPPPPRDPEAKAISGSEYSVARVRKSSGFSGINPMLANVVREARAAAMAQQEAQIPGSAGI